MQGLSNLTVYAEAFEKQLESVDKNSFTEVGYCNRYLAHLLAHKKYYIAIYSDLLLKMMKHSNKDISEIILVDYGAGSGLFGLFAKCCGFKKVYINDIDQNCINAAQKLAEQLNIYPDGYIHGDITAVQQFFKSKKLDIIAGTDVIEHIYDLSHFFRILEGINPGIISGFTTGSNPENFFKVRRLQRIQVKDEFTGSTSAEMFGDDPEEAFFKQRCQIIKTNFPAIPEATTEQLATATRGKNEKDIIAAVKVYVASGAFPPVLKHATNTCDPISGSWTERILSLNEYIDLYKEGGFKVQFYPGFYNEFEKSPIKKIFNRLAKFLGKRISPYIILIGKRIM